MVFVNEKWLVLKHKIGFSHAETIAFSIESDDFDCFLLACYRALSQSVRCFLDEPKNTLPRLNNREQFCLAGDINIDIAKQERSDACVYVNKLAAEGVECVINTPTREEIRLDRLVSSSVDHMCIRARNTEVLSSVITQNLADQFFAACQFGKIAGSKLETDNKRRIEIIDNKVLDRLI